MKLTALAIVNRSSRINDDDALTMATACMIQLNNHVGPAWSIMPPVVSFHMSVSAMPLDDVPKLILSDTPTVAEALGYHTEQGDAAIGWVFSSPVLDNGGSTLFAGDPNIVTVASVLSHEIIELVVNPYVNQWVDDGLGNSFAFEACDPVQDKTYVVEGCCVSNFVLPAWFDQEGTIGPFDYLNTLQAPFSMAAGGYMSLRNGGPGTERQVFGESIPGWRKDIHERHGRVRRNPGYFNKKVGLDRSSGVVPLK